MNIRSALAWSYAVLRPLGARCAKTDAQIMLSAALGQTRLFTLTNPDMPLNPYQKRLFKKNVNLYLRGHPLAYIVNKREFYGLDFFVSRNVLIPRVETEILVEAAISEFSKRGAKIIEIGTGCGNIAVALKKNLPDSKITATDRSAAALGVARKNARHNAVKITFRLGDLFGALKKTDFPADLIISNPPYIKTADIAKLDAAVKDFEPREALDGGGNGLFFYEAIGFYAARYLKKEGAVMLEIGAGQARAVSRVLQKNGFSDIRVLRDLSGKNRVVRAYV